jgi:hypothetical protein
MDCFTPAQCEVVNLMACLRSDADMVALKSVLVKFLDARIQNELDKLYDDGTLSDARMEELASAHLRTAGEVWRTPPVSPVLCG